MPRIIISYRREDSGVITGRIFDRLVAQYGRDAIFRDIDDVPFGVDFREHISRVIDESDIVLAIIGPRWLGPRGAQNRLNNEADPVRVEIELALRNSVPLIPLLVLRGTMPQAAQLPESLRDFAYRNALQIDAQQDFDVHMTRLLRAMDAILARAAEAAAAREAEAAAAREAETAAARVAEAAAAREAEARAAREAEAAAAREATARAAREAEAAAEREAEARATREAEAAAAREAEAGAAREAEQRAAREALATAAREAEAAAARAAEAAARAAEAAAARAEESAAVSAPKLPTRRPLLIGASIVAALGIAAVGWYLALDRQKPPSPADTVALAPNTAPPSASQGTPVTAPVAVPVAPAIDPELLFWKSIANNGTQVDFEEYLNKYPQGQFVGLARNRIAALQAPPPVAPIAPPAVVAPPAQAEGEAGWTIEEKREVQRALRTLGHYQGEPDGGFGTGTRAAISQFREFSGSAETGEMTEPERKTLFEMAQRLATLLDQPASSPQGVAGASIRGGAQRYARAWNFETGKGAKADPAEAAYWYALAAADGEAKAFTNLGTLIARGWGATKPDPVAAGLIWWVAAARGEPIAMFDEGVLYERGIGVTADPERAKAWYQRAAALNHPGAKEALKRLGA